jgi:hypothetical protein
MNKDNMNFYIKKGADLPILKVEPIKDGRSDYKKFMEDLESSTILFSMVDSKSGVYKIANADAYLVAKETVEPTPIIEYYIYYQFKKRETNTPGIYKGEFLIRTENGDLILPLREELTIIVLDSFVKKFN